MNIIEFIKDPALIGGTLSQYQETSLRLAYGLPLTSEQLVIAQALLDAEDVPQKEYREITGIFGRRSGKTDRIGANMVTYEATMGGHEKYLSRGEVGHCILLAQDKRAAKVAYRYVLGKLQSSPMLRSLIANITSEEIELTNRITISIFPCSFRAPRGFSSPIACLDEFGYFRSEGVNIDKEIVDSIRPAMATFPNSKLIKLSSPYAKVGELYRDFSTRHQRPDLLCLRASSKKMNPTIPDAFLQGEKERDPEYYEREFEAQFTDSLALAFAREAVMACVVPGRFELPPVAGVQYKAGTDPAGGGSDEFTLSVCHTEGKRVIQDALRAYRSKRPGDIVLEMAATLKSFNIKKIVGDRYSAGWVQTAFRDCGIQYEVATHSASEVFLELLPQINQGTVELLDDRTQTAQLIGLERRRSISGKDVLGHCVGGHDDRANALAHAVVQCGRPGKFVWFGSMDFGVPWAIFQDGKTTYLSDPEPEPAPEPEPVAAERKSNFYSIEVENENEN